MSDRARSPALGREPGEPVLGEGTALVTDLHRNALDDGPGIRTTVFFKGCPLACVWCQNPECLARGQEVQQRAERCSACGECAEACPQGAVSITEGVRVVDRDACCACGTCVERCSAGALRLAGTAYRVEELVELLLQDEPFFRHSGGGVTFSGGEPTLHLDFVARLGSALRDRGVSLLLETCGLFALAPFEARLLPLLDHIYFDVKIADPAAHRRHTGRDNRRIIDNLRRLAGRPGPPELLVRVPLVPGITDSDQNLGAIARSVREAGLDRLALLPYNPLWLAKRRDLRAGQPLPYAHDRFTTEAELERCCSAVRREGVRIAGTD